MMNKEIILKNRWIGREVLIEGIINCLKNNDNSWINTIKGMQHVSDIKNGRDLRGIPLSNKNLEFISFLHCDLSYADFSYAKLNGADFSKSVLYGAILKNVEVSNSTDWGINTAFIREKRKKELSLFNYLFNYRIRILGYKNKIYTERISITKDEYKQLTVIYSMLRIAYKNINLGLSKYFYFREKHCEMTSLYPKYSIEYLLGSIWEKTTCWGTAPLRFLLSLFIFNVICALPYHFLKWGIVRRNINNEIVPLKDFGEALYFSIVTFSSLGYGDFHANHDTLLGSLLKFLCCFETLVGVVSIGVIAAMIYSFMSQE